jgi:hypothetical protein
MTTDQRRIASTLALRATLLLAAASSSSPEPKRILRLIAPFASEAGLPARTPSTRMRRPSHVSHAHTPGAGRCTVSASGTPTFPTRSGSAAATSVSAWRRSVRRPLTSTSWPRERPAAVGGSSTNRPAHSVGSLSAARSGSANSPGSAVITPRTRICVPTIAVRASLTLSATGVGVLDGDGDALDVGDGIADGVGLGGASRAKSELFMFVSTSAPLALRTLRSGVPAGGAGAGSPSPPALSAALPHATASRISVGAPTRRSWRTPPLLAMPSLHVSCTEEANDPSA